MHVLEKSSKGAAGFPYDKSEVTGSKTQCFLWIGGNLFMTTKENTSKPAHIRAQLASMINEANRTALLDAPPMWSTVILSTSKQLTWLAEFAQAEWIKNVAAGVVFCVDYLPLRKTCPSKQEFYFTDLIGLLGGSIYTARLAQAVAETATLAGWYVTFVPEILPKLGTLQERLDLPPLVLPVSILVISKEETPTVSAAEPVYIHWDQYEESNLDIKNAQAWWIKGAETWQYGRAARYLALEQLQKALGYFGFTISATSSEFTSSRMLQKEKENMGTVLRQVAKKFPRPFFSYQNLRLTWARMSIAAGKFPEAEMILRQAMVAEPQAPDILTILGAVLWLQGQLQQALDTLKGALKYAPNVAPIHYLIGEVYREQGLLRQAENSFRQSLEHDRTQISTWLSLASVVEESRGPQASLAVYESSKTVITADATLLNKEGLCHSELGQDEQALSCYQQALMLKPSDPSILANKGLILGRQGKIQAALECYEQALKASPNDVHLLNNKGFCLGKLEQYAEALSCYEKALHGHEIDDSSLLHNKATCLSKLGRHKEALACYDHVLEKRPTDTTTLNNRGLCLLNLGRVRDALECYHTAIQLEPNNAVLWGNKGACLFKQGKYEEALMAYERALALMPHELAYYSGKGMCLDYLGRAEEAVACYNKALRLA